MTENSGEINGFVFLRQYAEGIKKLPEEHQLGALWAMIEYGLNGKEPAEMSWAADFALEAYKKALDNSRNEYIRRCKDNARKQEKRNADKMRTDSGQPSDTLRTECGQGADTPRTDSGQSADNNGQPSDILDKVKSKKEKVESKKEKGESANAESAREKKNAPKSFYGEFKNVALTDEQLAYLMDKFPYDYMDRIEAVSAYCEQYGKSYKNYCAAIVNWARRAEERAVEKAHDKITSINKRAAELKAQDDILEAWARGESNPDSRDFWEVTT